ncbi:carbon catabolite repressor protein 4 homolog 1-like isoform X1 [Zingiber officinale]|uniref:carbon catabolite repressor protein 4 homolog 1-like isoform X1 n=1 Tax=Zingiber officinale TaxID=94328 RepID=UPI001C4CBB37|nr:carbon catabolite repressor protein 4 homolog 1-like isoform X1 [Zingiber officinale]XP_042448755.1 carbon catabolite repressor protein 4 homolog 1-like isoform X1 [Zingiber officinale]XP_042448756.1 carbon catabolite repressor protein 4 homolog 1-like isoform X1 [Zingiber officinale]XP_042448757.1 carbon catabolite repressor protein 4 homolog 1-like isoform X1 [Zingiber officinale]
MLTVLRVHLPSEIPVVGCEITPYVLLRQPDGSISNDDVPESTPLNGYCMRYRWYRNLGDQKVAICSVHPTEPATLQCLVCLKEKVPITKSYHCSPRCFSDAWQHHRALHEQAKKTQTQNGAEEEEVFGRLNSSGSGNFASGLSGVTSNSGPLSVYPTTVVDKNGEAWSEVGLSRTYTPTAEDINHVLKFECIVIEAETRSNIGNVNTVSTSRVIPAPSPTPRRMIPVNGDLLGQLDLDGRTSSGTFSVLSYNILSDVCATNEAYSYCPTWALSWPYRRQNLLREIIGYHADIICLQEVQNDHFEEFFAPELDKHGYQALYKKKTSEVCFQIEYFQKKFHVLSFVAFLILPLIQVYSGNPDTVDGCATFFRRDRFSHVKKYEVEFNKAAQSLTDVAIQAGQKKVALSRLIKDNIALIVVLEAKFSNYGTDNPGKRQLICVANTHVNVHHEHKDVKLWQVHTLLKGLEKIAVSADIPMLVCGDFNSVPGSAPHALLANGKLEHLHPDLAVDPLGILHPTHKITHQLPLVSAYSSFARMAGVSLGSDQQRRRVDATTHEPLFTNCTRDFVGTVDYIFYTADSLSVESLLELLDEENLRKNTAIPSPEWSSDHIALLAEFRCKPRIRR